MNFKNLESDDILISPFEVNKTFSVTNNDSGSGVYSIPITEGSDSIYMDGIQPRHPQLSLRVFFTKYHLIIQ